MSDDRTRSAAPRALDGADRLRLIVFCRGRVTSHPLPEVGRVVLGRGEEADVRIDHVTVSRKHATLVLGSEPAIIDHGSYNGTSIGGRRIPQNVPVTLAVSTLAELGEAMVVLEVDRREQEHPDGYRTSPERSRTSAAMEHIHRLVEHVAHSNITVIVRGETGAGKEVIAEEIHRRSARSGRPIVKLNCAAIPEHVLEGELFGFERGAFTGAAATKPGLVEVADGGTLFLDEVGELPLAIQAKLLRVVESREVWRLGSVRPRSVDVRFIAATNRDLEAMVARGAFRQDLYYRLNGVSLVVPPLRERVDEIPYLVNEFVGRFCRESKRPVLPVTDAALEALKVYPWPGNVRELRNVVERAVVFCKSAAIGPEHLGLRSSSSSRPPVGEYSVMPSETLRPPAMSVPSETLRPPAMSSPTPLGTTAVLGSSLPAEVDALERERILSALAECGGNQTQAAMKLGISRRTLLRRLDAYSVPRPRKS